MIPKLLRCALAIFCISLFIAVSAPAQESATAPEQQSEVRKAPEPFARDMALDMLKNVADEVRKNYYDPKYRGIDFEGLVKDAQARVKQAKTLTEAVSAIGAMVDGLHDSHTFFIPPSKPYDVEHGWRMKYYGDHCYITNVKAGTEAAAQGLKPGDEVLGWEKFRMMRPNLWLMERAFLGFAPRSATTVLVSSGGAAPREVTVKASVRELQKDVNLGANKLLDYVLNWQNNEKAYRPSWVEIDDVLALKVPSFSIPEMWMEQALSQMRKHNAVVLDLRGNQGGAVVRLKELVSGTFDHEVKIFDPLMRKSEKPVVAKSHYPFTGKLIVLMDSQSASASELYARVVQLEKRGQVIGDLSSGSVMESRHYFTTTGVGRVVRSAVSVTVADAIMTDGKSLEKVGVTPDELILPTAADLAAGRDPVLAHAVQLVGGKLTPEAAGKMFPYEWPRYMLH